MIFIICAIAGAVGIVATLWVSSASLKYLENPVSKGNEWFSIHPDLSESALRAKIREQLRNALKEIIIWLIGAYRKLSQKIAVKQTVKKHVRAFLYDHKPHGARNPSAFLTQVRQVPEESGVEFEEIRQELLNEESEAKDTHE